MENTIKVFEALEMDARLTPEKISEATGVPVAEVQKIIKKAEKDGTIIKYKTVVNWTKLGQEQVCTVEGRVRGEQDPVVPGGRTGKAAAVLHRPGDADGLVEGGLGRGESLADPQIRLADRDG